MATWLSDNIIVTKLGEEVLSKVQMGIGQLVVSRVVSGGGYVSPAQLYKQTEVTSPKQTLSIIGSSTDSKGSELELSLTNANLTVEYDLYQIGVYITHTDYPGKEILYVLAQCHTATPDHIPLPSTTKATMGYSIYMEHSNTANVSITVDPAGLLTAGMLDKPNGIPKLGEDGKLPASSVLGAHSYSGECTTALDVYKKAIPKSSIPASLESSDTVSIKFTQGFVSANTAGADTRCSIVIGSAEYQVMFVGTGYVVPKTLNAETPGYYTFAYDKATNSLLLHMTYSMVGTPTNYGVLKSSSAFDPNSTDAGSEDTALNAVAGAKIRAAMNKTFKTIPAPTSIVELLRTSNLPSSAVYFKGSLTDAPPDVTVGGYKCYPIVDNGVRGLQIEVADLVKGTTWLSVGYVDTSIPANKWVKTGGGGSSSANYVSCDTGSGVAEKIVACKDFSLVEGARITVHFNNSNTVNNPTLNVNGLGAKPITDRNGLVLTGSSNRIASGYIEFLYSGGVFIASERIAMASNSMLGQVKLSDALVSMDSAQGTAATPKALFDAVQSVLSSDIDCGTFDDPTPVQAHNGTPLSHRNAVFDGNVTQAKKVGYTLAEHEVDAKAHSNILLDGNV